MQNQLSNRIVVMDFSGIYEKEKFFLAEKTKWINCTDITGKNCYCDELAKHQIRERISALSPNGIHFIDSGNYHYVSEFFTDKIKRPFVLIVFDHHSDMQKPLFDNLLSCGSWILNTIEQNPNLRKVLFVGVDLEQIQQIPPKLLEKIQYISSTTIKDNTISDDSKELAEEYPVYISIDKDVFSENIVETNWSQGDMKWVEFKKIFHKIVKNNEIVGIDICGECDIQTQKIFEITQDDELNKNLLLYIKTEVDN